MASVSEIAVPGWQEQFWMRVRKLPTPVDVPMGSPRWMYHPCWIWDGYTNPDGYGRLNLEGRMVSAHSLAYKILVGPCGEDVELDHLCRVRHCVNPAHVEPTSHRFNTLRGDTITADQITRTHCPYGHEYTARNTYFRHGKGRQCRECNRLRSKRERDERKSIREQLAEATLQRDQLREQLAQQFNAAKQFSEAVVRLIEQRDNLVAVLHEAKLYVRGESEKDRAMRERIHDVLLAAIKATALPATQNEEGEK